MWILLILALTLINIQFSSSGEYKSLDEVWSGVISNEGKSPINLKTPDGMTDNDVDHYYTFDTKLIRINTKSKPANDSLPNYILQHDPKGLKIVFNGTQEFQPELHGGIIQNTFYFAYTQLIYENGSEHMIDGNHRELEGRMVFRNEKYEEFELAKNNVDGILVLVFFGKSLTKYNEDTQNLFMEYVQNISKPGYENFGTDKNPQRLKLPFWYLEMIVAYNFTRYIYHGKNDEFPNGATYIVFPDEIEMEVKMMTVLRNALEGNTSGTTIEAVEPTKNQIIYEVTNELEIDKS